MERTKNGGAFYDIGANIGYMAISVANRGPKGLAVVAFEANPQLAQAIALSAEMNDLPVHVFSAALDETAGEVDFFIPNHAVHASLVSRAQDARRVRVQSVRLDDLVESGKIPPPTMIKIDVEGAEMRVFSGAEKTLRTHKPAVIYECDINLKRFGKIQADVEAQLKSFGYRDISRLSDQYGKLTDDYLAVA